MTDDQMLETFRADHGIGIGDAEQAIEHLLSRAEYMAGQAVTLSRRDGKYRIRADVRTIAKGGDLESLARDLFARFPEVESESAS